ncbi:phosphodiesterase [Companilactobacillus tucceti DSM 20183]|uniref:Ribonuclease Y n=1 Tax=Companilactobacillus tucceti DSM 20183 TaxID=1423811 RepID=A0A0R1J009_9LACO|nr:phosphodiesterase [Companilactobacillus tucceti DSM 20183]
MGVFFGYAFCKDSYEKKLSQARQTADDIVSDAHKAAKSLKKETLLEAKDDIHKYREEQENELKERRQDIQKQENRVLERQDILDRKDQSLEKREENIEKNENDISARQHKLDEKNKQLTDTLDEQKAELTRVSNLTREQARKIILDNLNQELTHERATKIKESDEQARQYADKDAKALIVAAIQRSAADTVSDSTVTTVTLPNEDMKGRIIGREGRNIRTIEALTGVDLIIDDTPEAVALSGFDPIRREIARMALEKLIEDGRIHPARIEEMVDKARREMDDHIREVGEQTIYSLGINSINPDLIKIIGRMKYRTSYGQNVLSHSIEVAKLSAVMAAELGEDVMLAKRAGLLHDIGKAIDREVDGSHVEIGVDIATKYKEPEVVINTIASHHGDVEPTSLIATIVAAADAISAARPGARSESMENYIHRLEKLENIANKHEGVDHSYAIQAGHEIRIMVKPEEISDDQAAILSRDVKNEIEDNLEYPGHIKVTVVREVRKVELAK